MEQSSEKSFRIPPPAQLLIAIGMALAFLAAAVPAFIRYSAERRAGVDAAEARETEVRE